jgi:AraC-like DNA-binding protein
MTEAAIQGRLSFSPSCVLFVGTGLCTRTHRHLSASITLSFDHAFQVRSQAGVGSARLMLIRPDTEHALDARGAHVINLQIDPETEAYARLRDGALRERELLLADQVDPPLRKALWSACAGASLPAARILELLLAQLGAPHALLQYDERVAQALALLKTSFPNAPSSALVAKRVAASESRLMHLFREQVGVPLRRYTLWLRLRHLLFCVAAGDNLTHAAHAAGFADSAHFARVFSSMFGVPPSALLRADCVSREVAFPETLTGPHAEQDAERLRQLAARFSTVDAAS